MIFRPPTVVAALMALAAIVVIMLVARLRTPTDLEGDRGSAHWMGVGIGAGLAIGMLIGLAIGLALDNVVMGAALGPAIGTGMGIAIGAALEAHYKGEVAPSPDREPLTFGRLSLAAGLVLFLALLVVAALLLRRCAPLA